MKIYLLRHGETAWNEERRIQGQTDVSLNDTGLSQAQATKKYFNDIHLDAVYTSTLQRSIQTAEVVTSMKYPIKKFSDLNERDFGNWQTRLWDEIYHEIPDLRERWKKEGIRFTPENGESLESLISRSQRRFVQIIDSHTYGENFLIACHGGPLKAIIGYVYETPWEEIPDVVKLDNCSITLVKNEKGQLSIPIVNKIVY